METRRLRIALVGWDVLEQPQEDILGRAEHIIREAKAQGVQAMGFTEYFAFLGTRWMHHNRCDNLQECGERPGEGPVTRWAVAMASEYDLELWCPFIESDGTRVYNSTAIVDPQDGIVGVQREIHCPGLRDVGIDLGNRIEVFQRPWGTLGVSICADLIPEYCRYLSFKGVDLVFNPALNAHPTMEAVLMATKVRCIESGFWLMRCSVSSRQDYSPLGGSWETGSYLVDPSGNITAHTGTHPGVAVADVDLAQVRHAAGREALRTLDPHFYGDFYASL